MDEVEGRVLALEPELINEVLKVVIDLVRKGLG